MPSTPHAFIFFGRYFPNDATARSFLEYHRAHTDSNTIEDASADSLGLQMLTDGRVALGFSVEPGESDAYARDLWSHRVSPYCESSQTHLVVYERMD